MSNKGLNINAVEFKPNPTAAVFVPGAVTHSAVQPPTAGQCSNISLPVDIKPEESRIDDGGTKELTKEEAISEQLASVCSVAEPSQTVTSASDANEPVQNLQTTNGNIVESWDDASESTPEVPGTPAEPADVPEVKSVTSAAKAPKSTATQKSKKDHLNIIFIGHVDAGKSTIGGQIMFLTGMVDKRTLEKYEREAKEKNRESWYLSWALDTNAEERDKGITVEVGRAYFETEKKHFTLLDAPGHKNFVPNMIGGASQADLAILVISARRGEFETGFERGGQTQEHALLVKTAGVKHLVVLINKMDDPTVNWDKARFEECRDKLVPYLKKVGFNPKTDIIFIPCSGLHGDFLKDPAPESLVPWYRGPCFIEYIDSMAPISRLRDGNLRIPINAKYNDMGTIVLGKVEAGVCKKGDNIVMMPNKVTVQVLQIWSDEEEVDDVGPGENVKMKLKNIEEDDILAGFVLCSPESLCKVGRVFDAQVVILERPPTSIIAAGYNAVLHIHAAIEEVSVKALICLIDRKTGEKIPKPRFVKQDQTCVMRLESSELFCLEPFSEFQQLGRFTLRDEGRTIAIGKVLKVIE